MNLTQRERELLFSPTSTLTPLERGGLALLLMAAGSGVEVERVGRTFTFESDVGEWSTDSMPMSRMVTAGSALGVLTTRIADGKSLILRTADIRDDAEVTP